MTGWLLGNAEDGKFNLALNKRGSLIHPPTILGFLLGWGAMLCVKGPIKGEEKLPCSEFLTVVIKMGKSDFNGCSEKHSN